MQQDGDKQFGFHIEFKLCRDGSPLPGWDGKTDVIVVTQDFLDVTKNAGAYLHRWLAESMRKKLDELEASTHDEQ